jgi:hypothetical protein
MNIRHLTIAVGIAAVVLTAAPAQAQIWNGNGRAGGYRTDARSLAYNNGYRSGLERGRQASRDRRAFDIQREKDYRKADDGYKKQYGSKDFYRDEFRRGFTQGYQEGYSRFDYRYGDRREGRYPNGRVYGDVRGGGGYGYGYGAGLNVAFRNGESDGYQKGVDDARDGKYPQAERQKWYREGDRNYNGRDGLTREQYKQEYRRGFQQGYARAYNRR